MKRGAARKSEWLVFLRNKNIFSDLGKQIQKAAAEYKAMKKGIKPQYRTAVTRRQTNLQKALAALRNDAYINRLNNEFGSKYDPSYLAEAIKIVENELDRNKAILAEQYEAQPSPQPSAIQPKPSSGYGLREGLGYGYGYFY